SVAFLSALHVAPSAPETTDETGSLLSFCVPPSRSGTVSTPTPTAAAAATIHLVFIADPRLSIALTSATPSRARSLDVLLHVFDDLLEIRAPRASDDRVGAAAPRPHDLFLAELVDVAHVEVARRHAVQDVDR